METGEKPAAKLDWSALKARQQVEPEPPKDPTVQFALNISRALAEETDRIMMGGKPREPEPRTVEEQLEDIDAERMRLVDEFHFEVRRAQESLNYRLTYLDQERAELIRVAHMGLPEAIPTPEPSEPEEAEPYSGAFRGVIIGLLIMFCAGCACVAILGAYYYLIGRWQ